MKAHLTKVSLALLSAAFLLGCQEQGSEPVGPEIQAGRESRKGKGDGSSTLAELIISGGMEGPKDASGEVEEQVVSFGDGKNQFSIQAHDNTIGDRIFLGMNLFPFVGPCDRGGTGETQDYVDLISKRNDGDPVERRQLFITVGKDSETSDENKINVTWNDDDGKSSFRMELTPNPVLTDADALPLTFTFTGGTVVLRDVTEKRPKDRIKGTVTLDPLLEIFMDLTLAPAA